MNLANKVCVITGGANGLGKAAVEAFLKAGAIVSFWDLNDEAANAFLQDLKDYSDMVSYLNVDVSKGDQVDAAMNSIKEKYGRLDVLVNNAGITRDATLLKMEESQFDQVLAINLKGVFNCGQAAGRIMKVQNSGVIINTSSVVALYGNFGQTNYVASKAGVIGMTKVWARELGKYGVRVNAVAPGFIMTDMVAKMPEKIIEMMKAKSPLGRLGEPQDIADAYLFLASDSAKYITGTTLSVDGGLIS
jgi:3-oxoacyl-[acyl-carrier protein] reductase